MKKILSVAIALATFLSVSTATTAIDYYETINSVVLISVIDSQGDEWMGSGFFISKDGLILTNSHVIIDEYTGEPSDDIVICTIQDGNSFPECKYIAEVWIHNPDLDLALIAPAYEVNEEFEVISEYLGEQDDMGLSYVDLADYNPMLGDNLKIFGFPGASLSSTVTVTQGIVSGFTPLSILYPELSDWIWKIETDATINPGNSGGPAYNEDERVIGIVTEISTEGLGGNYGYIISNDLIYLWFWDLVEQGYLNQGFVEEAFSNDYIDSEYDPEEPIDWGDLGDYSSGTFYDINENHQNLTAINTLFFLEIINGYPDGSFRPDGEINRAELIKMVVEMMTGEVPDADVYKNCFPDVETEWFAPYVCYAKEQTWIEGYPDNSFKPSNNTNRVEAMKIIVNAVFNGAVPVLPEGTAMPVDSDQDAWYYPYLKYVVEYDLLDLQHVTYTGGFKYFGGNNITRKEVAETIYRMIEMEVNSDVEG